MISTTTSQQTFWIIIIILNTRFTYEIGTSLTLNWIHSNTYTNSTSKSLYQIFLNRPFISIAGHINYYSVWILYLFTFFFLWFFILEVMPYWIFVPVDRVKFFGKESTFIKNFRNLFFVIVRTYPEKNCLVLRTRFRYEFIK